jgi:4-amino-4-deoxy-L-arabinose transferase-like glycosyltransferase
MLAWITGLWFAVFPRADWAFYLLAMLSAAVALWFIWRATEGRLSDEKRVAALALATFIPFYNFLAFKYNANMVLIPFWAATSYFFLRSYETRGVGYAALAGAAAAGAMLGKYWSVSLLAGLVVAALLAPQRKAYFRSAAPWVTIATGAVLLAPHLWWVVQQHGASFAHLTQRAAQTHAEFTVLSVPKYLANTLAYCSLAIVLALLLTTRREDAVRDTIWPDEPGRRLLALAFFLPVLLPALYAVATQSEVHALWNAGVFALLSAVLLASPKVTLTRTALVRLVALAAGFPLLMLALSPAIAVALHWRGAAGEQAYYRPLARSIEQLWRETGGPLRVLAGDTNLINGISFYLPEPVSTYDILQPALTPWADPARMARDGVVFVCPVDVASCAAAARKVAPHPHVRQETVSIERSFLGVPGPRRGYLLIAIPPRS